MTRKQLFPFTLVFLLVLALGGIVRAQGESPSATNAAQLTKTSSYTAPLCPGSSITFQLTLTNSETEGRAQQGSIVDPLPSNTTYLGGSTTGGATFVAGSNQIEWSGQLAPGESVTIGFVARVNDDVIDGTEIFNRATASLQDATGGSTNDSAQTSDMVNCPTPTATPTNAPPTHTPTPTPTATRPPTDTPTATVTPRSATATPTPLPIGLPTDTPTPLPIGFPTNTPTPLPIGLPTNTPTPPVIVVPTSTPVVYDIAITGVEISQGTQDLANSIPLIQDRRTIVRVYVQETTGKGIGNVRAHLHARRIKLANGTNVNQDLGLINAQNHPLFVGTNPSRVLLNDSFWFYLPESWRSGTVEFEADVNYDKAVLETDYSNNKSQRTGIFRKSEPLNVLILPLEIHEDGSKKKPSHIYYCQNEPNCNELYLNALRRHPISTMNVWLAANPLDAVFGKWGPDDKGDMLKRIDWFRFWHVDPADDLHYYGMIDPFFSHKTGTGLGRSPGWAAVGRANYAPNASSPWWIPDGNTVAHELGHNKGLLHIACDDDNGGGPNGNQPDGIADEIAGGTVDPNYPWSFPNCRIAPINLSGYYGLDVYWSLWGLPAPAIIDNDPSAAAPNLGWPMMSYGEPRWISPWEYCNLMNEYGVSCNLWSFAAAAMGSHPAANAAVSALLAADEHLLVNGSVDRVANTATLAAAYRQTETPANLIRQESERLEAVAKEAVDLEETWTLTLEDAAGAALYSRPLIDDEDVDASSPDYPVADSFGFVEVLPFPAETKWLRVRHNDEIIAERSVSENAPQVQVLSPNNGNITVGTEVQWDASDADGDSLSYIIQYSGDGGVSWLPLVLDTEEMSLTLTEGMLHDLHGGNQGIIKVIASDGINTGEDTSDNPLSAPNTPPDVMLSGAGRSTVVRPGDLVTLTGGATDVEDGVIPAEGLTWHSSRDGDLGTGFEIATDQLATGLHIITLSATDNDGASGQATTEVYVLDPSLFMPMIVH